MRVQEFNTQHKMKFLTITTLFLSIIQLSYSQNIIQNGDFENGTNDWFLVDTDIGASANIDNSVFSQGNKSMKLEISNQNTIITAGIFQTIAILPNTTYLFSYTIKTSDVDLFCFPYLKFHNGSDFFTQNAYVSGRTKDWTTYSMRTTTPNNVTSLDFLFFLSGNNGIVWLDELNFSEITSSNQLNFTVDINAITDTFNTQLISTNSSPIRPGSNDDFTLEFQEIGIEEVRTHDIYNSCDIHIIFPSFSADPLNPNSYDFSATDSVIQSIINAGATPIFRLGESYDINSNYNNPPLDFNKWATICLQIVKHYNAGWNNGFNYNIKKWEVWNEPDLEIFWSGTSQQFYNLYNITATKLKNYDANLKVGTAGFATISSSKFIDPVLDSISSNNTPIDFISYHSYTFSNPYYFYIQEQNIQGILSSYGLSNIETYLTEWSNYGYNTETTLTDYGRDDALSASLTASSFYYLQNSTLSAAQRYRTDEHLFGLFRADGNYSYSGQAFKAISKFKDNNQWIQTTGSDTLGTVCMAGKSNLNDGLSIIVSNPSNPSNSYSVNIQNLIGSYNYQISRIDNNNELVVISNGVVSPSSNIITSAVSPPFVDLITFDRVLGLNTSVLTNENVILFPNPTNGNLHLKTDLNYEYLEIEILSILGTKKKTIYNQTDIIIDFLPSGVYFVQIKMDKEIITRKIIKK